MNYFSELKIFYSNCRYQGNAWTQAESNRLLQELKNKLEDIDELEFQGINLSTVRGGTQNFQITVVGTFDKFSNSVDYVESLNLNEVARMAGSSINGFIFEEIRIEHTRHRSMFGSFNVPALLREY